MTTTDRARAKELLEKIIDSQSDRFERDEVAEGFIAAALQQAREEGARAQRAMDVAMLQPLHAPLARSMARWKLITDQPPESPA